MGKFLADWGELAISLAWGISVVTYVGHINGETNT
jgi:hypothetical protein